MSRRRLAGRSVGDRSVVADARARAAGSSSAVGTLARCVRARRQLLPVPGRQRRPGRQAVPRAQPDARADRRPSAHEFNLDGSKFEQFVAYVEQTLQGNLGDSFLSRRPVTTEIREALWPTIMLVGTSTMLSMVIGIVFGIYAGWRRRSAFDAGVDDVLDVHLLGARLLARHGAARGCSPCSSAGSRPAASRTPAARRPGSPALLDQLHHMSCRRSR